MTMDYRFQCLHCGYRVHATGDDAESARRTAREKGAEHVNEVHAERLTDSPTFPNEVEPEDLLSGTAAYSSIRGWLVPADDLLVCADCGYFFGQEGADTDRRPASGSGLVCTDCHERRLEKERESVSKAIEKFVR